MSTAPLPHTSGPSPLSMISPPNGSSRQPDSLTGTTSVWPIRHRLGAFGSVPEIRPTIDVRPAAAS